MVLSADKKKLLSEVEEALTRSGYAVEFVGDNHPIEITASTNASQENLRVYVWNVTHGGKNRDENEYRIQITGVDKLEFREGERTLLLGIASKPIVEDTVIVAFDPTKHETFGSSPSIQIHKPALVKAVEEGIATESKELADGSSEVMWVVRPENLGQYIGTLQGAYHAKDKKISAKESEKVANLDFTKPELTEEDLKDVDSAERKKALVAASRWIRDQKFGRKVLNVYNHKCAMCGVQGRLVQGAHIVPVKAKGTDEVTNGLALCRNHHGAYDLFLLAVDEDGTIKKNKAMVEALKKADLNEGLDEFFKNSRVGEKIYQPKDPNYAPKKEYLKANIESKGKKNFD